MTDLDPGTRLGRYSIEGVLGRGGMGIVYSATQDGLDRTVALKVIAPHLAADPDFRARFQREAKLAASLEHPNVVPVYEAGEDASALFLAMRFIRGEDLSTKIKRDGPLPASDAIAIIVQIADALDAAHDAGLVHRDVKPHNILLSGQRAYLTDFGLTKSAETSIAITRTGMVLGTIDYASPEQLTGETTDRQSDIYSLACTTYHVIAGKPPFERASDTARMLAHMTDPPPELPTAPPPLSEVLKRGMAKLPADRYATAGEFAEACVAALSGTSDSIGATTRLSAGTTAATPAAVKPESPPKSRTALRILLPAVLVAGLVVAVLAATGVIGGSDNKKGGATTAGGGKAPQPISTIQVGVTPDGMAVGTAAIWVVTQGDHKLVRIDPVTGKVAASADVGAEPDSVAAGGGSVFVSTQSDGDRVLRFEAHPNPVLAGEAIAGPKPESVSLGPQLVWVAVSGNGTVRRLDRASNAVVGGPIGVGDTPIGINVGDGRVWVANSGDGTVSRINSMTAEPIGTPIPVGKNPRDVVEAFGFAWVVLTDENAVVRLDLDTGKVVGDPIGVGLKPHKIAAGEGALWVTNSGENTVSQIDPKTFRVAGRPLPVGERPLGIVAGLGSVWVSNADGGTVTQIDPGTPLAPNG
ncbi:MAG: eukaryotic-like serine/threonine-protein kinase [Solirubrobacteraceae bacterium]|nr:eukaryotic-like serine/threonine-protein kinase [Solirubrobacteraceae bacterium]